MAAKAKPAQNAGLNTDDAQGFVERIENLHDKLESMKGSYMADCKVVREDIKAVYDEAKESEIPKKALKAVVTARQLERRANEARDDLDSDDQDLFDAIRLALGDLADTPLGGAAVKAAKNGAEARA